MNQSNFWESLEKLYDAVLPLLITNLLWFLLTLAIVTALPALGGLFYATNRYARQLSSGWGAFWTGFRTYFWKSVLLGLVNITVIGLALLNVWFYGQIEQSWADILRIISVSLLVLWLLVQMNVFPMLIEQEEPKVFLAMRNSAVVLIRRPLQVIGTAAVVAALALLTSLYFLPGWAFITAAFCAYLLNRTSLSAISHMQAG